MSGPGGGANFMKLADRKPPSRSISVPAETYEKIRAAASAAGLSIGVFLERALEDVLDAVLP